MKTLLITPPFVQLNTPYPATGVLTAFLRSAGKKAAQFDLGIVLIETVFAKQFLEPVFAQASLREDLSQSALNVLAQKERYLNTAASVVRFLQGKDDTLAVRIASGTGLPESYRVIEEEELEWAFGSTATADRAKYLASLFMIELADFVSETVSENFQLIKYGEQLSLSLPSFDPLEAAVLEEDNLLDEAMFGLFRAKMEEERPDVVGFTIPFPGTLLAALKCARLLKKEYPGVKIVFGGGYVSTELRSITDPRIFDYIDFLLYDDGEGPLLGVLRCLEDGDTDYLLRTKYRENGAVVSSVFRHDDLKFGTLPAPVFDGLNLDKYISLIEFTNPMHKLWSDGKWLKMTLAHGCYWAKCTFCDTKLDYICRYDPPTAATVVDKMEEMMHSTGISGFHFTDEALPPALLMQVAQEIIDRGLIVSFWGNIRFEKSFDKNCCELLARAGCIAVSGGIEVADKRILGLINKGITVEGAVSAAHWFTQAGIMVHAYLMYGFPTQTMQECVDSLEIVRQMFEQGLIQSGFWHRYTMTVHSSTGTNPERFGAQVIAPKVHAFANNGVSFTDGGSVDYQRVGEGLRNSIYNYMKGVGYDVPVGAWFGDKTIRSAVGKNFVHKIIKDL